MPEPTLHDELATFRAEAADPMRPVYEDSAEEVARRWAMGVRRYYLRLPPYRLPDPETSA